MSAVKVVGDVEYRRRPLLHANLAVVEVERGIDVARARHHEALAVIIGDSREIEIVVGLARHAPCRVTREDVDLAALQFLEAFAGVERDEFRLLGVVEDRRGHRAAEVDVEAGPVALVVGDREAGQPLVDATQHFTAADGPLQRLGVVTLVGDGNSRDRDCDSQPDQEAASKCPQHFLTHDFREMDRLEEPRRNYSSGFCRMMTLVPTGTRS
jgi:hypothetical protein